MIKKTITYKDYNDKEHTEDFYFHLTDAELMEMEISEKGGLVEHIQKVVKSNDGAEIVEVFKDIIKKSHGCKSEDGRRFVKTDESLANFMETEAYSNLFMEVCFDADKAAAFIRGIVPARYGQKALAHNANG